jgi:hypothetical protein
MDIDLSRAVGSMYLLAGLAALIWGVASVVSPRRSPTAAYACAAAGLAGAVLRAMLDDRFAVLDATGVRRLIASLFLIVWAWGPIDAAARSDRAWMRADRNRWAWIVVSLLVPVLGSIAYLRLAHPALDRTERELAGAPPA